MNRIYIVTINDKPFNFHATRPEAVAAVAEYLDTVRRNHNVVYELADEDMGEWFIHLPRRMIRVEIESVSM